MSNKPFFKFGETSIIAFKYLMGYIVGLAIFIIGKPESELISRLAEFVTPLSLGLAGCLIIETSLEVLNHVFEHFKKGE